MRRRLAVWGGMRRGGQGAGSGRDASSRSGPGQPRGAARGGAGRGRAHLPPMLSASSLACMRRAISSSAATSCSASLAGSLGASRAEGSRMVMPVVSRLTAAGPLASCSRGRSRGGGRPRGAQAAGSRQQAAARAGTLARAARAGAAAHLGLQRGAEGARCIHHRALAAARVQRLELLHHKLAVEQQRLARAGVALAHLGGGGSRGRRRASEGRQARQRHPAGPLRQPLQQALPQPSTTARPARPPWRAPAWPQPRPATRPGCRRGRGTARGRPRPPAPPAPPRWRAPSCRRRRGGPARTRRGRC